ncbi:MAG: hypothetical protein GXO83_08075 [Chlorobi bacterium]|nr:hypothetical protein [Chlorobiota bacterium]
MKTRISDLTLNETIDYLDSIGDNANASEIRALVKSKPALASEKISEVDEAPQLARAAWRGTEHTFGYIQPFVRGGLRSIAYAAAIKPDMDLAGARINVMLSGLFTMNYPGWGRHQLLMQFNANHGYVKGKPVRAQFQQKFVSRENEGIGSLGNFIFTGLSVPAHGIEFYVEVINLANEGDETALDVLESDVIKKGLDLAVAAVPSLETITTLGEGIVKLILSRNRNKIVQSFNLGLILDDHPGPLARLREGTFVAAQAPRDTVNWDDWVYDAGKGLIVLKVDTGTRLPYNHLLFTVNRYAGS